MKSALVVRLVSLIGLLTCSVIADPGVTVHNVNSAPQMTTDHTCGRIRAGKNLGMSCGPLRCCSKWGYCGLDDSYCGAGCQASYGRCAPSSSTTSSSASSKKTSATSPVVPSGTSTATCGKSSKLKYAGELCCSSFGHCGSGTSFCGVGCQSDYGTCDPPLTTARSSGFQTSSKSQSLPGVLPRFVAAAILMSRLVRVSRLGPLRLPATRILKLCPREACLLEACIPRRAFLALEVYRRPRAHLLEANLLAVSAQSLQVSLPTVQDLVSHNSLVRFPHPPSLDSRLDLPRLASLGFLLQALQRANLNFLLRALQQVNLNFLLQLLHRVSLNSLLEPKLVYPSELASLKLPPRALGQASLNS